MSLLDSPDFLNLFLAPLAVAGVLVEKILKHCGLWKASAPRGPPDTNDLGHDLMDYESMEQMPELTYVDMDTFQATF